MKEVQGVSLALGAMGVMGNKGAVGIRLKIAETSMCFVTTHLAPHMSAVQKRNQNFIDIFTQLEFARIEDPWNVGGNTIISVSSPTLDRGPLSSGSPSEVQVNFINQQFHPQSQLP